MIVVALCIVAIILAAGTVTVTTVTLIRFRRHFRESHDV